MESPFMHVEEVAVIARVNVRTVNRWCLEGRLKAHRVGRRWLIQRADLEEMLRISLDTGKEENETKKANTLALSY
jgi:excisionase family DNA binding protein